jgi:DNA polymerase-3 subunit gamma/tau
MTFSDLVGQETVSSALSNAIRLGREPHGVIFSGVRGIGKTTTARLYAKALNCTVGLAAEPCGSCENCEAIARGNHEDVFEIDGASNNGVDEIRSLRETVNYAPQRGRYRVYIIDEVHMLSTSAFNALLKTLEEPPPHVVFILATTEIHKLPDTISSRCLTFHLQKMKPKVIVDRIADILVKENIKYEEKALWLIAREGQGSMRDALTFLDQVIALGDGQVTLGIMKDMVTGTSIGPYIELLSKCLDREGKKVLHQIAEFDSLGVQAKNYVSELATLSRHALIVRTLGIEASEIQSLGLDDGELSRLSEIAVSAKDFDLNRLFRTLVKCLEDLDGSEMDRYISENYLLEWCFDPGLPSIEEMRKGHFLTNSAPKAGFQRPEGKPVGSSNAGSTQQSSQNAFSAGVQKSTQKPLSSPTKTAEGVMVQNPDKPSDPKERTFKGQAPESHAPEVDLPPSKTKLNVKNFAQGMRDALAEPLAQAGKETPPTSGAKAEASFSSQNAGLKSPIQDEDKKKSNLTLGVGKPNETGTIEVDRVSESIQDSPLEAKTLSNSKIELSNLETSEPRPSLGSAPASGEVKSDQPLNTLSSKFPESWTVLVEIWKRTRPLEARKLEEVIPLEFNQNQIRLGVKKESLSGQALLQSEGLAKLKQDFKDVFSFQGLLLVDISADMSVGESLLEVRQREAIEKKEKLRIEAIESPFVKQLSTAFGAPILNVRVSDSQA